MQRPPELAGARKSWRGHLLLAAVLLTGLLAVTAMAPGSAFAPLRELATGQPQEGQAAGSQPAADRRSNV
jgi:hypothetical protein